MSQSPQSYSFTIMKHIKSSQADKEPDCKVILKTAPTSPFQARIEISNHDQAIFDRFPLDETVEVSFRNPQTRLGEGKTSP